MPIPIRFEEKEKWHRVVTGYDRILLGEAIDSARRSAEAQEAKDPKREAGAAAASILCAAAACEAWVSEVVARECAVEPIGIKLTDAVEGKRNPAERWKALLQVIAAAPDGLAGDGAQWRVTLDRNDDVVRAELIETWIH